MGKKGSLNLSIEAIVIIVIAFVVLGLGLGFVRNQFGSFTDLGQQVTEQVRQQITDDLSRGDKKLSFPISEISLGKKEAKVTALGIKNVKAGTLKYEILIEAKGGAPIFGSEITDNFLYTVDIEELQPTETRIIPIRFTSETISGTGQFKVSIYDVTDETQKTLYDSKNFFITVTG
ncbi:hypothetical protein J4210_05090 [Candidatus Woesearchaeota archaeon]|nr:hypothetical protein [Candidatus Woesearchaeota archaeon]